MPRSKKPRRIIRRTVRVYIGGKCIKTHKTRLTIRAATREVGEDCWFTKGDKRWQRRRVGIVSVDVTWEAVEHLLGDQTTLFTEGAADAVEIIRAGVPL